MRLVYKCYGMSVLAMGVHIFLIMEKQKKREDRAHDTHVQSVKGG